jgi:hypothetical protein
MKPWSVGQSFPPRLKDIKVRAMILRVAYELIAGEAGG